MFRIHTAAETACLLSYCYIPRYRRLPSQCINGVVLILAVKRLMKEAQELRNATEQFYAQPLEVCFTR